MTVTKSEWIRIVKVFLVCSMISIASWWKQNRLINMRQETYFIPPWMKVGEIKNTKTQPKYVKFVGVAGKMHRKQ